MKHSAESRLRSMLHCAESMLKISMLHSAESIFIIEYLREYEFIFETALAHESGDPGVLIDEKTEGRKSRATVPLSNPTVPCRTSGLELEPYRVVVTAPAKNDAAPCCSGFCSILAFLT
jgi:hypothetical protein